MDSLDAWSLIRVKMDFRNENHRDWWGTVRAKSVWCITRQPGNEIGGTTFTNVRVMISFGLADALP